MKSLVKHWRYDDGWQEIPLALRDKNGVMTNDRMFNEDIVGWHCWVYPCRDRDVAAWMKDNMIGDYECDFKFNSGDPMYLIIIRKEEDATLFKLTWM